MRPLLLALLLTGCGYPVKIHPFHLSPGQSDVVWIYIDGVLRRCEQTAYGPACVQARMLAPPALPQEPAAAAAPKVRPKAKPAPELPAVE